MRRAALVLSLALGACATLPGDGGDSARQELAARTRDGGGEPSIVGTATTGAIAGVSASVGASAHANASSDTNDATNPSGRAGTAHERCPPPMLPGGDDPGAPGPWAVGVRTVELAGLTTEVWYPTAAPPGAVGALPEQYDLRAFLPASERAKIPDADAPLLPCDCTRDAPIDGAHGPYPLVFFVHGYTLFRVESVHLATHWASHGFVVVSADYPNVTLAGVLEGKPRQGARDEARAALRALRTGGAAALGFAPGLFDVTRIGLVGHSMGGGIVATLGGEPGVELVATLQEGGIEPAERTFGSLVVGGTDDPVERYTLQQHGYDASPRPRRFVGLRAAGHLVTSDLCAVAGGRGLGAVLLAHGIKTTPFIARLARTGCATGTLPLARAQHILAYATTAALAERLLCDPRAAARLDELGARFGNDLADYAYDP